MLLHLASDDADSVAACNTPQLVAYEARATIQWMQNKTPKPTMQELQALLHDDPHATATLLCIMVGLAVMGTDVVRGSTPALAQPEVGGLLFEEEEPESKAKKKIKLADMGNLTQPGDMH